MKENEMKIIITIIVNGRERTIESKQISFEQIVILAFEGYSNSPEVEYTVTYSYTHNNKGGSIVDGENVKVKEGMVFNVTKTNKS